MSASTTVASVLITSVLYACSQREPDGRLHADGPTKPSAAELEEARAAFDVVYEVLQHPRCLNCHPAGERPLQFDTSRPHVMNVVRGEDDGGMSGMRCGGSNPGVAHLPPGVSASWRLAPRSMVFEGLSKAELAAMLGDTQRSHMTPAEILEHVEHDPLVRWGWDPGPGREPVSVAHADFVAAVRTWIEAGAPALPEGQ